MNAIAHASAMPANGPQLDNRRVLAGIIDLMVVLAGALVIGYAAGLTGAEYGKAGLAIAAVIAAWALYYYFACESGGGQTLGKRVMKIRVVGLDGEPAGMGDIAVRTVLRLIDGLFLYLVGLIVMLVTGERRGRLGDLAAGTMIVSADPAKAPLTAVAEVAAIPTPIVLPTREPEPEPEPAPVPVPVRVAEAEDEEEPVVVKSLQSVSAIDLVMEEEEPKGSA